MDGHLPQPSPMGHILRDGDGGSFFKLGASILYERMFIVTANSKSKPKPPIIVTRDKAFHVKRKSFPHK